MKKEWIVAGGICFIVGLLFLLSRSFSETEVSQFLYGTGFLVMGESLLAMFLGLAYPKH